MTTSARNSTFLWIAIPGLLTAGCGGRASRPEPIGTTKEATVAKMEFSMSAERANDPRLEPLRYLEGYGKEHPPELAFDAKDASAWKKWRRDLRKRLCETIGLPGMDDSGRPAVEPRKLRVTAGPVAQCDGYKRMAFTIETGAGLYVPAFLLVPDGLKERRPAILCSHGHGIGMNDLVALTEKGEPRPYKEGYHHDFAIQAVKAGFVALAFDQMGFGRRRDIDFHKQQNMWNHCE
jgi:hypothetical protein